MTYALLFTLALLLCCAAEGATRTPLRRAIDLDLDETATVELADGSAATVKLLRVEATCDNVRHAVRESRVTVEVNGTKATLCSGNYQLPVPVGGVQIDCPITNDYYRSTHRDAWGLKKAARLRLWPAGSPWIEPGTFGYPAQQRWFATYTQMANEPTYVNGDEQAARTNVYYHNGLDIGGCDGAIPVVAATDALVVCRGEEVLKEYEHSPSRPRYDLVYLMDDQGWYYRYSHLDAIDPDLKLGARIKRGTPIGMLGKEGASGGWAHLHFDIQAIQPSGEWGTEEGYCFLWQGYQEDHPTGLLAVARPHHLLLAGETAKLDGSKSWSASGIASYEWQFCDGTTASGPTVERSYPRPGVYAEALKITDQAGQVCYDVAVVEVHDPEHLDQPPPTIHPAVVPSLGAKAGQPGRFYVRTYRSKLRGETWDFGDGTPLVKVESDGNAEPHAKPGYAICEHTYAKPGWYLARATHTNEHGVTAIGVVPVLVGE